MNIFVIDIFCEILFFVRVSKCFKCVVEFLEFIGLILGFIMCHMVMKLHDLIAGYFGYDLSPSVTGNIKKGSMIAIVGPNGIGKSVLLRTLAGFLPPISGKLDFGINGRPSVGYLPQRKKLDYQFPLTVFDVVSMGWCAGVSLLKKINQHQKAVIFRSLRQVKLLDLIDQYIGNLSGGQFQRMLFARILVQKAALILLDEPFQSVDNNTCDLMIKAVYQLCKNGCTAIIVLHDMQLITQYFSDVLLLTYSRSVWISKRNLFDEYNN